MNPFLSVAFLYSLSIFNNKFNVARDLVFQESWLIKDILSGFLQLLFLIHSDNNQRQKLTHCMHAGKFFMLLLSSIC